ncbi:MAG: glycosyltransferase family A protein [Verrucomicrobiia bacterium]
MKGPLVSIGFPVFNGEKSLGRALDSVLTQDFKDFEVVLSDNASTDGTAAICRAYAKRDTRIRYFRNETNIGVNPNHNRVFELSRGKYFAWMAHDVEQLPGMISRCVREMNLYSPPVVLTYPWCELVDENGQPVGGDLPSIASNDLRPHRRLGTVIRRIGFVTQHFGLFSAETLRKTRLNGSYPSSDFVLTAELAMLGEIREIPEVLVRRCYETQSGTRAVMHDKKAWAAWLDPKMKDRHFLLRVEERLALEYVRSALTLPLQPLDKLACTLTGPYVHYRRRYPQTITAWRMRLGHFKRRLLTLISTAIRPCRRRSG